MKCCHTDRQECNCYDCLRAGFYGPPDKYECEKRLNFYVLNYGPSYASEVYHYLSKSRILETFNSRRKLKVLSLGCGFAPDLAALEKYIADEELEIGFKYCGIDQSTCWDAARYYSENATFTDDDVISAMDLTDYDLVFIMKLFSTLLKNNLHRPFLRSLSVAVKTQLRDGGIVVFNDINHYRMGRDEFHDSVKHLFRQCRQFYCDNPGYTGAGWIKIPENNVVFSIEFGVSVFPLLDIGKTVFFEYRK